MFSIEIPCCDLRTIYEGTQAYRWRKVSDNKYIVINGGDIVLVEQKGDKKIFYCSEDMFFDKWYDYFDVGYDYHKLQIEVKRFYKFVKARSLLYAHALKQNRNLHVLRPCIPEALLYYSLDEQSRLLKFNRILEGFGEKHSNFICGSKVKWIRFPDPEKIVLTQDYEQYGLSEREGIRATKIMQNYKVADFHLDDDRSFYKDVMFYVHGCKEIFNATESERHAFDVYGIKPENFQEFDEIKGMLLEYYRVEKLRVMRDGNY